MSASVNSAIHHAQSLSWSDEMGQILEVLQGVQRRLDVLGVSVAAAHLDACLHEISRSFISDNNASKAD
jgi:hypothetical protein